MMNIKCLLAAVMAANLSAFAANKGTGERYAFYGDSITHAGDYVSDLQLWEALRHPGKARTMINVGVAGETQRTCLYRFDTDLLEESPTRVFLTFGMNDVWRCKWKDDHPNARDAADREEAFLMYRTNLVNTIRRLKSLGIRPTVVSPFPYDQYSAASAENMQLCNEPGLATLATIARTAAKEEACDLVDTHPTLTDILRRWPERKFCREDRVHPGKTGHLLIAAEIVRALEGTRPVARVRIADGALKSAENAEVSGFEQLPGGGVAFDYLPKSLPFPMTPEVKEADEVYPFTKDLNRETLEVKGLPEGRWMIVADGKETLAVYSSAELAAGVNLAYLKTPNAQAAEKLVKARDELQELVTVKRDALFAAKYLKPSKDSNLTGFCGRCILSFWRREKAGAADDRRIADVRRRLFRVRPVKWNVRIVREGTPGEPPSSAVPEPPYCNSPASPFFVRNIPKEIAGRRTDFWWQVCSTNYGYAGRSHNVFLVQHPKPEKDGWNKPLYVVLHSAGHDAFDAFGCTKTLGNHDIYRAPEDFYALYVDCRLHTETDWWWGWEGTNYHGTALSPCEKRVIDTVKWTVENYHIDPARVYLSGNSMGGSGTLGIGLRHGDVFAAIKANVPALVDHAMARLGAEDLPEPPVCVDYSGAYDGWSREHEKLIAAMHDRKFSYHLFWGPFGHENNTKSILEKNDLIEATDWLSVRKDEVYPVFTDASSDDPSPWPEKFAAKARDVPAGQINGFFRWKGSVATADGFTCELSLITAPGPKRVVSTHFKIPETVTANVTFRRLGAFKVKPGETVAWTYGDRSGTAVVGDDGLLTLPSVAISATPQAMSVSRKDK